MDGELRPIAHGLSVDGWIADTTKPAVVGPSLGEMDGDIHARITRNQTAELVELLRRRERRDDYIDRLGDPDGFGAEIQALKGQPPTPELARRLDVVRAVLRRPGTRQLLRTELDQVLQAVPLPERYVNRQAHVRRQRAAVAYVRRMTNAIDVNHRDAQPTARNDYAEKTGTRTERLEAVAVRQTTRQAPEQRHEHRRKVAKTLMKQWSDRSEMPQRGPVRVAGMMIVPGRGGAH